MRLVDADAFAMYLQLVCKGNDMSAEKKVFSANGIIHMLQDMPTASDIKWTPVTEKLPEEKKDVMVTVHSSFDGEIFVAMDSYWGGDDKDRAFHNGEWFSFDNDVVAWAEIPKAYEVKEV